MATIALTQCWYTRLHVPERKKFREDDGSWSSSCRHCQREIRSWSKDRWYLADGFNVTRLAEETGTRFLYVFDAADDFILHRFPVSHLPDEAAIDAYKAGLAQEYGLDQPGCDLELRDSRDDS